MNNDKKVFAFKLAEKKKASTGKWKAREGVSLAGCTDSTGYGDYRDSLNIPFGGDEMGQDQGFWC